MTWLLISAPTGVVNLDADPSLSQILLVWDEPTGTAAGIFTRYEVLFALADGSTAEETVLTDIAMYTFKTLVHGTSYTVSVTAFSLFGRGTALEETIQTLSEPRKL